MSKHTMIGVSVTIEEKELLKAKAKAEGISLNSYCKQILLNADFNKEITTNIEFLLSKRLFQAVLNTIEIYFDKDYSRLIIPMDKAKKLQAIGNLKTDNEGLMEILCQKLYVELFADEPEILSQMAKDANPGINYINEYDYKQLAYQFGYTRFDLNTNRKTISDDERMQIIFKSHEILRECFCYTGHNFDKRFKIK